MLSYVNLYCNTSCDSRCTTCSFWRMRPRERLTPEMVASVTGSRFADSSTWFALQGGEFTLHPQADAILEVCRGTNFIFFTNLLSTERAERLIVRHRVAYVTVSLDGGREGYRRIRGVDAFDRVTAGILRLRRITEVSVGLTLTPWTRWEDYVEVAEFCRRSGIDFGVNVYTDSRIYRAEHAPPDLPFLDRVIADCGDSFVAAYADWKAGRLHLPCRSIREVASISPDGDVHLCHNQDVILGNLRQRAFDEIWGDRRTRRLHERFESCNDCWTSCYRSFDLERSAAGQE